MKTDETNFPKDPAKVTQRLIIDPATGASAAHTKASHERERDALDAWRDELGGQGGGQRGYPQDPVRVHGLDLDNASPRTRAVIEAFSEDLARLHRALEAAEARLTRAEYERQHDPETGLLRRESFFTETRHLELLDRREGAHSELALFRVGGFHTMRQHKGWAHAEEARRVLGRALAAAVAPAEPASSLGDGDFAVLLTGLHGPGAERRAQEIAAALVESVDHSPETVGMRPGRISVGRAELGDGEAPLHAIDRADHSAGL